MINRLQILKAFGDFLVLTLIVSFSVIFRANDIELALKNGQKSNIPKPLHMTRVFVNMYVRIHIEL